MANRNEIIIRLNPKGEMEVVNAFRRVERGSDNMAGTVGKLTRTFGGLGAVVGTISLGALAKDLFDTNVQFQDLNASLVTVTGSQRAANQEFAWLTEFASTTPYQLADVVDAFIKMEAMGLRPTQQSLRSFGNTASSMGKDLNQMIEAVADAATGEFERLKEFGIKASKQGEDVTFTFRGVKTTVKAESAQIVQYLQQIGEVEFAGGMERKMGTLGGATSNLKDSWDQLLVSLGNIGPAQSATDIINSLSSAVKGLSDFITTTPQERLGQVVERIGFLSAELEKKHTPATVKRLQERLAALREEYRLLVQENAEPFSTVEPSTTPPPPEFVPNQDTVALGIAAGNATPDDMWLARMGLDQAAMERAKTTKLELIEWNRQIDLEEGQRLYEAEMLRFQQKQEAVDREIEMLQWAAEQRADIERDVGAQILSMKMSHAHAALGLMQVFNSESKAMALAGLVVQKGLAIAETFIQTQAAASAALAPPPLGLGPVAGAPLAAAIEAQGQIRMGLIAATGLAQAFTSGGGGGNYGRGTPGSPTVTAPPPAYANRQEEEERPASRTQNFYFYGNVFDADRLAREIVPAIRKAEDDGV